MFKKYVVHCKREPYDILVDRTTKWGNPFMLGKDGDREEVIQKFEFYLVDNSDLFDNISDLRYKVLGCWCDPKNCHGHVLVRYSIIQALQEVVQATKEWWYEKNESLGEYPVDVLNRREYEKFWSLISDDFSGANVSDSK